MVSLPTLLITGHRRGLTGTLIYWCANWKVNRSGRRSKNMDVRAQLSMVFHLDKCIGCHTCSIACKNLWTSRDGAEYMWWNNVETKPGTGYPTLWEDQARYRSGWGLKRSSL